MRLMSAINVCALDVDVDALHLHAACATRDGRAAVFAAERNTGKTTTVAHLVARGWVFVTDEMVRLGPHQNEVSGFPKPLSIKPGGLGLLPHVEPWLLPTDGADPGAFRFVPVGATGGIVGDGGTAHLVVVLRRLAAARRVASRSCTRCIRPTRSSPSCRRRSTPSDSGVPRPAWPSARRRATASRWSSARRGIRRSDRAAGITRPGRGAGGRGVARERHAEPRRRLDHDRWTAPWSTTRRRVGSSPSTREPRRSGSRSVGGVADDDLDLEGAVLAPFVSQLRTLGVFAGTP